ncbi:MAG TPA: hypothetical protein PKG52_00060 [bacterium]|nr:hypothetical protein [bacterium]HPS28785.1 hypothetical protein [bacterium]
MTKIKYDNNESSEMEIKEITIKDIILFVSDNWKSIGIYTSGFFFVLLLFFLFLQKPVYKVNASIEVIDNIDSISLNPMSFMMGVEASSSMIANEELFNSRLVIDKVINNLNLQVTIKKKNNSMFYYIIDVISGIKGVSGCIKVVSFPDVLKKESFDLFVNNDSYNLTVNGKEIECFWNIPCEIDSQKLVLDKIGELIESAYNLEYVSIIQTRLELPEKFSAKSLTGTNNINLQYFDENPYTASMVLDNFIEVYESIQEDWDKNEIKSKKDYISTILDGVKNEILLKAETLVIFQQENNTFMPVVQFESVVKKIEEIRTQIELLKLKQKLIGKTLEELNAEDPSSITISYLSDNLSLVKMVALHNDLISRRDFDRKNLTDSHPDIVALGESIIESKKNIEAVLKQERTSMQNGVDILENAISTIMKDTQTLPKKYIQTEALKKDLELTEKLYVALTTKLYESTIDKKTGVPPVKVIDFSTPDVIKNSPSVVINVIVMFLLSFLFSLSICFIKEVFRVKIKNSEELNKYFINPVIIKTNKSYDDTKKEFVMRIKDSMIPMRKGLFFSPDDDNDFSQLINQIVDAETAAVFISKGNGLSLHEFSAKKIDGNIIILRVDDDGDFAYVFKSEIFKQTIMEIESKYKKIIVAISSSHHSCLYALTDLFDSIFYFIQKDKTSLIQIEKFSKFSKMVEEKLRERIFTVFFS